ncbi:hypothetical protein Q4E93_14290 [Flavitalea sp. BT771]|uniref:hypothetical protein n=1 Tax=Flavitalea sp. BT771 TaxID=3063329 RepID=UPI0026E49553|nr:hypothetical protein [Flavitalea sp. BT771]MDO6431770.1 hypothetical protein [Flavitalea sp. BT771]MDV6220678.1 hypothetical protein [Flavitalea sp. BT771]
MLQNRVDPWGVIITTSARGAWMGNRGVLHDEHQTIRRPFKLKAWITCVLQFKGRHRKVMSPDRWTELFFLDEATSLAAGHRPCFECRRNDAVRFKKFWLKGNPEYGFNEGTSIGEIDKIIHGERIDKRGGKVTYEEMADRLPDGSFVEIEGKAYVVAQRKIFRWSPFGYENGQTLPEGRRVKVLTPASIVRTIRAGYVVQINDHSAATPAAEIPSN